jgi:hypothetical protein
MEMHKTIYFKCIDLTTINNLDFGLNMLLDNRKHYIYYGFSNNLGLNHKTLKDKCKACYLSWQIWKLHANIKKFVETRLQMN